MSAKPKPRVWQQPLTPGETEVFKGFGGIVAPLLAGFSLTAVATLVVSKRSLPLLGFAVTAFTLSTVLFLFGIQFAFMALRHHVSPSERLSWTPEATSDEEELQNERWSQALDMELAKSFGQRVKSCYNLAMLSFIAGVVLLIVPGRVSIGRILAILAAALAGIVELLWVVSGSKARWLRLPRSWAEPLRRRLLPGYPEVGEVVKQRWEAEGAEQAMLGSVLSPGVPGTGAPIEGQDRAEGRSG